MLCGVRAVGELLLELRILTYACVFREMAPPCFPGIEGYGKAGIGMPLMRFRRAGYILLFLENNQCADAF